MDLGALPPEINSARMYAGPGPESMLAAAAAWKGLAAQLHSGAAAYTSVVSELTSGPWQGPSSTAMEAAAAPYAAWMSTTAEQAELAATQAQAAASAYETAFAMTVSPPVIAANRTQLASLTATNIFGQNTPAIAANEAQYGEMWAQDATAMYGYAGSSAAAARVTPFTAPPSTTNPAGAASQAAAVTQASGTATGNGVQSALSQLSSTITSTLQNLASPAASSTSSTSLLSPLLNDLGLTSSATALGPTGQNLVNTLVTLPISDTALFGLFAGLDGIGPLIGTPMNMALSQALTPVAAAAGGAAAAAAAAPMAAAGVGATGGLGGFAGLGGLAGLGQAASVGALSVPQSWGWAATPQAALLGGMPLATPLAGANLAAASGLPMAAGLPLMMGGIPKAAGVAAAAGIGGAVASKYGKPRVVVARPPSAGYPPEPEDAKPATAFPVPAGFSTNGHAPPGYTPAIVYVPTNGHAPPKN